MKKYNIGFTQGTFDMFHIGHLNLIRRAKQYCDYLIVGVHPPGSSHKNKPTFIPLEERMEIAEQQLPERPVRNGFTAVEWGGSALRE